MRTKNYLHGLPLSCRGKQKRRRRRLVLRVFALVFFVVFCLPGLVFAQAEEGTAGKEELNQNILEQIEKLATEALQEYIDSLGIFSDETIGERLFDYIKGEQFDYGGFGKQILNVLF